MPIENSIQRAISRGLVNELAVESFIGEPFKLSVKLSVVFEAELGGVGKGIERDIQKMASASR